MEKNYQEEKEYLEATLCKFNDVISYTQAKLDALPRLYKDDEVLRQELSFQYGNRLVMLRKTENKPYFARINFKDEQEDEVEECYIGKVGVFDEDNEPITIDWRAPIASMYYDSNIGNASYEAPCGIINGELLVKRQYDIEDGKLKSFYDVDTVSNDEILKPYLGVSADNRLKNIVATIQAEQNEIIREKIHNNLIVQGVAGSGKTTVALHRIAYLVYNNIKNIDPRQYLVIGPNKFFVNYISSVLPDLDVNNVSQLTYDEIVKKLIKDEFKLLSDEDKLVRSINGSDNLGYERLKVSMYFKESLDKFLDDFDKTIVPLDDFMVKGYKILSRNVIDGIYKSIVNDGVIDYSILAKKIDRTILLVSKYIAERKEQILVNVQEEFHRKSISVSGNELDDERKKVDYIKKELRNNFNQSLKNYFSVSRPKILNLYVKFLDNIEKYIDKSDSDILLSVNKNIMNIKKKCVEFEDLGALLYLYYRIYGSSEFIDFRHTVIDEAQDFGELNFYSLKKLMPNCTFSIFGDLAQSIYQYRGIKNWQKVIDICFSDDCDLRYLKKSYRTTTEIMNEASRITKYINLVPAEAVIRHGVNVNYINVNDNKIEKIYELVKEYINKDYKSIAIITKEEKESNYVYNELLKKNIDVVNVTGFETEYKGGICTITSYLAKGLEFDGVIVVDASETVYNSEKIIDMKLLYVAMTRPLHELNVLYDGNISKPLISEIK